MCKSSAGTGCTTSGEWAQGWIVFVDVPTGTIGTFESGTDTILRVHGALDSTSALVGKRLDADLNEVGALQYITYLSDGRSQLDAATIASLDLCPSGSGAGGRRVRVALGRAQLTKITC